MDSPTPDTASLLSLSANLDELDLYFQVLFDQLGNLYSFFDDINCLLADCPLEFIVFETQHFVSFLQQH